MTPQSKLYAADLRPNGPDYPALLKTIHDPPEHLYIRGELNLGDRPVVAVVGSRKATPYGRQAVSRIVEPLAQTGVVIVSGLAYGIDAVAHEAALKVGGTTIAVLGTPIDQIYPRANLGLGKRILESGGAILSEVAPNEKIHRGAFPRRNRIIAGMSHATIVVEAALQSGSLITARLALEENREVLAVPGPIQSLTSMGANNLLKLGARPVTEPNDLLAALGLPLLRSGAAAMKRPGIKLDPEEERLLEAVPIAEAMHIDNLVETVTIDLPVLQSQLALLELRGLIRMVQPGMYIRIE